MEAGPEGGLVPTGKLEEPLVVGGHTVVATGSIGVAVAPDQGVEIDRLLRMADEAMYRAKELRNEQVGDLAAI